MTTQSPINNDFEFGQPTVFQSLGVLPVFNRNSEPSFEYLTLDEAFDQESVRIEETSDSGNVPELLFKNLGEQPVLLVDGEELLGAKQNRSINLTVLAPAQKNIVLPVSCVEAGRWSYSRSDFTRSDRAHFARGRAKKMASVSASMYASGSRRSDQGEVWSDIDMKFSRMNLASDSSAMADMFEATGTTVDEYVGAFTAEEEQTGAFFFVNGSLLGFECFDKPATFTRLLPKLLRSYAIDAIEEASDENQRPDSLAADAMLASLNNGHWRTFPSVGLGTDYRFNSPRLTAASLLVNDDIVHSSAFVIPTDAQNPSNRRMASLRRRRQLRGD